MEGEVCHHHKFGFCKYKLECTKLHYKVECEDPATCKNVQSCTKRHPKCWKKFATGYCRFLHDCAYKHQEKNIQEDEYNLIEKVNMMEKKNPSTNQESP